MTKDQQTGNKEMNVFGKRLKSIPLKNVRLQDKFWEPRVRLNREVTLPSQYKLMEETGRIDNFRRAAGKKQIEYHGPYYNDSDVYKWLEAASYSLETHPDPELQTIVDNLISEITAAPDRNGYLNTHFIFEGKKERWTNLQSMHELYCAGHLFEAAVAHHQATGKESLLKAALRFADHIYDIFGPNKKPGAPGHEEIELALVKLYKVTGHNRYLDLAKLFLDQRGQGLAGGDEVHQDHLPFRQQKEMVGHAVRAVYLLSGAADIYAETGEQALFKVLHRCWMNMLERRIYITGGVGARYQGEAFGKDYELPNDRAYTETCAAIGSIFWNSRMLQLTSEARYADLMETTLYNGFLSGLSLDGKQYFYQNPLRDEGTHRRQDWFSTACCPPNIARLLASLGGYFYSISEEGVWVHLYATSKAAVELRDGRRITLNQQSNYPWEGNIEIKVTLDREAAFTLFLRIPGWCKGVTAKVNGKAVKVEEKSGFYLPITREWKDGDRVKLNLHMPVRLMKCHPHSSNNGRLAICRGPLVYCLEAEDHPGIDLFDVALPPDSKLTPSFESTLVGGITVIRGKALLLDPTNWRGKLYRTLDPKDKTKSKSAKLTAIPYYAWANRQPGKMQVWIPYEEQISSGGR